MGRPKSEHKFHIVERKNNPFWWCWFISDEDGKRKRKSTGYKRSDYTREQVHKIFNSEPGAKRTTDYSIDWLIDHIVLKLEIDGRRKSTIELRKNALKHLRSIYGKDYSVLKIGREAIDNVKMYIFKKKVSPVTINTYLRQLRASFEELLINGQIDRNPFYKFKKVTEPKNKKKHLSLDDILNLFKVIGDSNNEDLKRLLRISLFTGLRRSEILFIQRVDVDLDKGIYRALNIKSHDKHKKTREIPNIIQNDFKYFLDKNKNTKYPFKVCHPNTFTHWTKQIFRRAELSEKLSLKSIRHTFVTRAAEHGEALRKLQKYIDHSSIIVTVQSQLFFLLATIKIPGLVIGNKMF